jgi:hypothetical protein
MGHRFVEVLAQEGPNGPMEPALRRFWSRGPDARQAARGGTLEGASRRYAGEVVDLAAWREQRQRDRPAGR